MASIEIKDLTKKYGDSVEALRGVTFNVERGEWIAVMGPSGSGKSTLLNILGCLDSPSSGQVAVEGCELASLRAAERARFRAEKVGFILQQFHLVPYLTALENVMLAQYFHSLADEAEAEESLRHVGLADRLGHLPSQLSGGEQQRVCVARALINQPNIILADEPTGNLDEVNEALVLGLFTELHREGHTIVMVTHDPEVGRRAERHIELHHGRLSEATSLPAVEAELIDNLLKAVWHAQEDTGKSVVSIEDVPEFLPNRAAFLRMAQEGLVHLESGKLLVTSLGQPRATQAIRRHRLAERLLHDTFEIANDVVDAHALRIEHTLSPHVTEKICIFLTHPRTCPHGSPIPPGACCRESRR